MKRLLATLVLTPIMASCATSSQTLVDPRAVGQSYESAFLETHGGNSSDMDVHLQKALFRRGISVRTGPIGAPVPNGVDFVVKYVDEWKWDITMYLNSLDVQVFDAKSGELLANGTWKNSAVHGFYNEEKITDQVVGELLSELGVR